MQNTRVKPNATHDKKGKLTAYGFACGYIMREEKNGNFREIYMEHSHYHVRHGKIGEKIKGENWQTFERNENKKARSAFSKIKL